MKRRLRLFGTGALIGLPLSIALFQYASRVQQEQPREVDNVEVVLTTCALEPGDLFEQRCVEARVVPKQFVPPDAIAFDNIASWVDKPVHVKLAPGHAVRTVDFAPLEP